MNHLSPQIIVLGVFYQFKNDKLWVWVQRRETNDEFHNLLEFPGGKKEKNETLEYALKREIKEEVKIDIEVNSLTKIGFYPGLNNKVLLIPFLIKGSYSLLNGEWIELDRLKFNDDFWAKIPAPNRLIFEHLVDSHQHSEFYAPDP